MSGRGELPFAAASAPSTKARTEEALASPVLNLNLNLKLKLKLKLKLNLLPEIDDQGVSSKEVQVFALKLTTPDHHM